MVKALENYVAGVLESDREKIGAQFSPSVQVHSPAGNTASTGVDRISANLSKVKQAMDRFAFVRFGEASDRWHTIQFAGEVQGVPFDEIDLMHLGEDGLIDEMRVFFRPAPAAELFVKAMKAAQKS